MISITNLTQRNGDRILLDNITLTVPEKTVFGILCQDKAERIALMEALAGICVTFEGEISLCGHSITNDRLNAQLSMSYMPEDMPFYKNMTVIEYLSFITEAKQLDFEQAQKNIKSALTSTNLLALKDAVISKLSSPGRARLGIAQAIASNSSVLLFCNPTSDLSKNEAQEIFKLIKTVSRSKSAIIVSNDPQVLFFCDSGAMLSDGKLDTNIKSFLGKEAE